MTDLTAARAAWERADEWRTAINPSVLSGYANRLIAAQDAELATLTVENERLASDRDALRGQIEAVRDADQPVRDWAVGSMQACVACVDTRGSWRKCSYHEGVDDAIERAFESVESALTPTEQP